MKALVIRHPFAHFVADGKKALEIRPFKVNYRGPLLIIGGLAMHDGRCIIEGVEMDCLDALRLLWNLGVTLPMGTAIAQVDLVDCRPMTELDAEAAMHPYVPGAYVWELRKARRVKPFPMRGQLGLMNVEAEVEREIEILTETSEP